MPPPVDDLRARIAARRVVVIAGSGVASAATGNDPRCSWEQLIASGLDWAKDLPGIDPRRVDAGRTLLETKAFVLAAEVVTDLLGGRKSPDFSEWLRKTMGTLELEDPSVPRALAALDVPLATTNFDVMIEKATGLEGVAWRESKELQRVLQEKDERAVMHLHGVCTRPDTVILGARSYEELSTSGPAQALQQTMAALHSLLFVGVGDGGSDPNLAALREWLRLTFPDTEYRHYRLCLKQEFDALVKEHARERIVPIAYGNDVAELAPFLEGLVARDRAIAPPRPAARASIALPARPDSLGRVDHVWQVARRMLRDPPEATLLQGPLGVGKTNLTLAAMHDPRVVDRFGARRWFVRCETLDSAASLVSRLAMTLGIPPTSDALPAVISQLAKAPGVLALDSLETPLEFDTVGVEEILGAVAGVDGIAVVASIRGERRPAGKEWNAPIQLAALDPSVQKELFLSIAPPRFDAAGLDELLKEMGGVTLAIELLAHAARDEASLDILADRWRSERAQLLYRGSADDPRLSIAVSVDTALTKRPMTEPAGRLLGILGRLPDGVALHDLRALLPTDGPAAASTLRGAGLVVDDKTRLQTLAPVRHHLKKVHPPGDKDWDRTTAHYLRLAERLGGRAGQAGATEAQTRLSRESANVAAVLTEVLGGSEPARAYAAAQRFIEAARFSGAEVGRVVDALIDASQRGDDPLALADAYLARAEIALVRFEHAIASEAYQRAEALYERASDVSGRADCALGTADIALARFDYPSAQAAYERARELYVRTGDFRGQANGIKGSGDVALAQSHTDVAARAYVRARQLYGRDGNDLGRANCIKGLGDIAFARDDHPVASQAYKEAQPLFQQVGDVLGQAGCIKGLADIALAQGDHGRADVAVEEAHLLYVQVGDLRGQANCKMMLGDLEFARSDSRAASDRYREARKLYAKIGDTIGQANCVKALGDVAAWRSEADPARRAYEDARQLYRRAANPRGQANCVKALGEIALAQGELQVAIAALEQASTLYAQARDVRMQASCVIALGDLALKSSDEPAARAAFEHALSLYTSIDAVVEIGETCQRLARLAQV
jgi:tetratricopeptide (TPR) repeat protein